MIRKLVTFLLLALPAGRVVYAGTQCETPAFLLAATDTNLSYWSTLGDFDGDGITDVITAEGAYVDVYRGTADHKVGSLVLLSAMAVDHVNTADLNGDGKLDIVGAGSDSNRIVVGINNGNYTLTSTITFMTGAWRTVIDDFNHDGKKDIAVITRDSSVHTLKILLGNGNGTFAPAATTSLAHVPESIAKGDLDGDGNIDLVIGYGEYNAVEVFKGVGDGTFATPASLPFNISATPSVYALAVADLNNDQRPEIIAGSIVDSAIAVFVNHGDGTFQNGVSYSVPALYIETIATGDFNGDGLVDVVVGGEWSVVRLFPGNGNGALGTSTSIVPATGLADTHVGTLNAYDWNGDGRLDLVVGGSYLDPTRYIELLTNECGAATKTLLAASNPLVTLNQSVTLTATVTGVNAPSGGDVTFKEGAATLGTVPLDSNGKAEITASFASAGDHPLTATYNGGSVYDPSTSDAITVRATTATTTTTLSLAASTIQVGVPATATVVVTSSTGDSVTGLAHLTIDSADGTSFSIPTSPVTVSTYLTLGGHTVVAHYEGDATHPRSDSAPVTFTLIKQTPSVSATFLTATAGQPFGGSVLVNTQTIQPTGTFEIKDGTTTLLSGTVTGGSTHVTLPGLSAGVHRLEIDYSGDSNFEAANSGATVGVASTTFGTFIPYWDGANVVLALTPASGTNTSRVYRKSSVGGAATMTSHGTGSFPQSLFDSSATPNGSYLYWIEYVNAQGAVITSTPVKFVNTFNFTNDPVVAGTTTISATHFTEILSAVNSMRTCANLSPMAFTDGTPAAGALVRGSHVDELRTAINAARVALGANAISWSDPTLVSGTTLIKATHLQELRDAIR